ncbi:MAG: hypothetical protein U5R49_01730 [Deltaproteobacteria bacterium]|nr:hypothetical protein [Deltaproteobacteria bacterium]
MYSVAWEMRMVKEMMLEKRALSQQNYNNVALKTTNGKVVDILGRLTLLAQLTIRFAAYGGRYER